MKRLAEQRHSLNRLDIFSQHEKSSNAIFVRVTFIIYREDNIIMLSTLLLRRGGISSRRVAGGEARRWFSNGGFGESSE